MACEDAFEQDIEHHGREDVTLQDMNSYTITIGHCNFFIYWHF